MSKNRISNIKFQYTVEWQLDLLKYIAQDKEGYKVLNKIRDDYFTLIEHQLIALTFLKFYKKINKVPGETLLREEAISIMNSREYIKLITVEDKEKILSIVNIIYNTPLIDATDIYNMCKKFSAYIKLKNLLEEIDPRDWEQYNQYQHKFQNAIEDEDLQKERESSFLFNDINYRQLKRKFKNIVVQTPIRQVNQLTNADGYEKGSIIVILDKQKKGKTTTLVNIGRGYLRMRKKVLYVDTENGKDSIFSRFEQSICNIDKKELMSGDKDDIVKKKFRKYKRLGGEVIVERVSVGTTCNNIQYNIIDKYYREYNIRFDVIIIDYAAKLGSNSGKKDDTERISDVYNDIANLALRNDIDHVWTANHVTREAAKLRMKTRYTGEDIAKCIDISRHVHAIYGLNRSPEEEEEGFLRMELVEQRDGKQHGRAVFSVNFETQRMDELTKTERESFDQVFSYDEEVISKDKNKPNDFN